MVNPSLQKAASLLELLLELGAFFLQIPNKIGWRRGSESDPIRRDCERNLPNFSGYTSITGHYRVATNHYTVGVRFGVRCPSASQWLVVSDAVIPQVERAMVLISNPMGFAPMKINIARKCLPCLRAASGAFALEVATVPPKVLEEAGPFHGTCCRS